MWFAGTAGQRRLTVAFRIILLIPQAVVLFFLSIALAVVVIIGWFGALFTGRLPAWAHEFIGNVLRWYTRVGAYATLLTDQYPPFTFEDESYPVRPVLPAPVRLNRWAVFFRVILVIPASVFAQIVRYGLTVPLIVVVWFIVLITSRMPPPLYSAYSALLRYEIRLNAYLFMLTSEYAWGMLGERVAPGSGPGSVSPASYPLHPFPGEPTDAPADVPPGQQPSPYPGPGSAETPPPASGAPASPAWGSAGSGPASPGEPDVPTGASEPVEGPGVGAVPPPVPSPSPPPPPQSWPPPSQSAGADVGSMPPPSPSERVADGPGDGEPGWATLVLAGAARGWIIFAIVWGSIVFLGESAIQSAFNNNNSTDVNQYNAVVSDYNATGTAVEKAFHDARTCTTVQCLRASHLAAAGSLSNFAGELQGMSLPATATGSAPRVESDAHQLATIFTDLANSPDAATYRATVQRSNLSSILNSYPMDTQNLLNAIKSDSS
jgi:hypothetical protein